MRQTRRSGALSARDILDEQTCVILILTVVASILSGILTSTHVNTLGIYVISGFALAWQLLLCA